MKRVSSREAFDKFKPESCVFVVSVDRRGSKPSGMVAGWNMKCSYSPPMLAVCLSKMGNTHRLIRESKEFVVAVPNKGLERQVEFFGSTSGKNVDKFKESKIATSKARVVKSPLIRDATVNFECKLVKECRVGDHVIFIGRVVACYVNPKKKVLLYMKKVNGKRIFKES